MTNLMCVSTLKHTQTDAQVQFQSFVERIGNYNKDADMLSKEVYMLDTCIQRLTKCCATQNIKSTINKLEHDKRERLNLISTYRSKAEHLIHHLNDALCLLYMDMCLNLNTTCTSSCSATSSGLDGCMDTLLIIEKMIQDEKNKSTELKQILPECALKQKKGFDIIGMDTDLMHQKANTDVLLTKFSERLHDIFHNTLQSSH